MTDSGQEGHVTSGTIPAATMRAAVAEESFVRGQIEQAAREDGFMPPAAAWESHRTVQPVVEVLSRKLLCGLTVSVCPGEYGVLCTVRRARYCDVELQWSVEYGDLEPLEVIEATKRDVQKLAVVKAMELIKRLTGREVVLT